MFVKKNHYLSRKYKTLLYFNLLWLTKVVFLIENSCSFAQLFIIIIKYLFIIIFVLPTM